MPERSKSLLLETSQLKDNKFENIKPETGPMVGGVGGG